MTEVGTFEAKNRLSELLDKAERGEEVIITRRGRPIVRLVPISTLPNRDAAREAAQRIRERAKKWNLGPFDWEEWKKYRDEGRE
jgi:prevent-host-death family protein